MGGKKLKLKKASKSKGGHSDSEDETRIGSDDEPTQTAASDGPDEDEEEDDEEEDEANGSSSAQRVCKHAGKQIKGIRGKLKMMPALLAAAKSSATKATIKEANKKKPSTKSSSSVVCWVCSSCGDSDDHSSPSHFVKKHEVGFDLVGLTWYCFECSFELDMKNTPPKAWLKLKAIQALIEKGIGATSKKGAAFAAASKAAEERAAVIAAASSSSAGTSVGVSSGGFQAKGLRNLGNTCFFNSVMQCLASIPALYGSVLYPVSRLYSEDAISQAHPLQAALLGFLTSMAKVADTKPVEVDKKGRLLKSVGDDGRVLTPSTLLSAVQTLNPMFRGNRQHDAHELLRTVLNGIAFEKEDELRKRRQLVVAGVVSRWSVGEVRMWIKGWQPDLTEETIKQVLMNLTNDKDVWDGRYLWTLVEKWMDKQGKKPRLVLHTGINDMEQKKQIARQFQRLKDGNIPQLNPSKDDGGAADCDAASDESSSSPAPPPLHPFTNLMHSTFVHSVFGGVARNTVECLACHTVSVTHEYLFDISLAIEAPRTHNAAPRIVTPNADTRIKSATSATTKSASSSSPIVKKSSKGKHLSKQQRKLLKRQQRAGKSNKEEEHGEEEEDGDDDDDSEAEAKHDDDESKSNSQTNQPPDALASNDPSAAPSADSALDSSLVDLTRDVDRITISDADPHASAAAAAVPLPNESPSLSETESEENVDTNPSTTAPTQVDPPPTEPSAASSSSSSGLTSTSAPSLTSPSTSSFASAAVDFLSYARSHHLGFDRLQSSRVTLESCLGAFTDPDLLTGTNRYGCKECSRRMQQNNISEQEKGDVDTTQANEDATPTDATVATPADTPLLDDATHASPSDDADNNSASTALDTDAADADPAIDTPIVDPSANGAAESSAIEPPSPKPSPPPPAPIWIKQDAIKRSQILVPPNVLTLHLKRFHATSRSFEKSSKGVDFPLCLDLADYMTPPIDAAEVTPFNIQSDGTRTTKKVESVFYHLIGIVSHGGGMGGGHYVAYCRKQNLYSACAVDNRPSSHGTSPCAVDACDLARNWYYFSDSEVRPITVTEVLKVQAYILIYERV